MRQHDCGKSNHRFYDWNLCPKDVIKQISNDQGHDKIHGRKLPQSLLARNTDKRQGIYIHNRYAEDNSGQVEFHGIYDFLLAGFNSVRSCRCTGFAQSSWMTLILPFGSRVACFTSFTSSTPIIRNSESSSSSLSLSFARFLC